MAFRKHYACLDHLVKAVAALKSGDQDALAQELASIVEDPEVEDALEDLDAAQQEALEEELDPEVEEDEDEDKPASTEGASTEVLPPASPPSQGTLTPPEGQPLEQASVEDTRAARIRSNLKSL